MHLMIVYRHPSAACGQTVNILTKCLISFSHRNTLNYIYIYIYTETTRKNILFLIYFIVLYFITNNISLKV